jgi:hypothetical protein
MEDTVIPERHIVAVAADSKHTTDEITEAVQTLHDAIQSRLPTHYEQCWFKGGKNHLLFDFDGQSSSWFAFNSYDLKDELQHSDEELSDELLLLAAEANLKFFQDQFGYSVSISKTNYNKSTDPLYYPICIEKSQEWQNGFYHAMQMLKRYLFHYEMSAAEALDYWALERVNVDTTEWSKVRRVGRSAVRKNARQGSDKLGDETLGQTHHKNQIEAVRVEDVPDNLQDDDRVYVGLLDDSDGPELRSVDES